MKNEFEPESSPTKGGDSKIKDPYRDITPFISLYESVTTEGNQALDEGQRRAAIALAVMTENPAHLRSLSDLWELPEEQLRISIRDAFYNPIIKGVGYGIFDKKNSKQQEEKEEPEKENVSIHDLAEQVYAAIPNGLLTDHQRVIFDHVRNGLTNQQIGELLGIQKGSVAINLVRIRHLLDPLVKKAGLVRVAGYGKSFLVAAASDKVLESEKILRLYHTRPDIAEAYLKKRRAIDPNIVRKGNIPLSDRSRISEKEHYTLLQDTHRDGVIRKNNRAYVSQAYLEKFKAKKLKRKSPVPEAPTGYKALLDCIPLPSDHSERGHIYRMTLYHLKMGNIHSVRKGKNWFVQEKDVKNYIEGLLQRRDITPQS